jgi:hypothetical protein
MRAYGRSNAAYVREVLHGANRRLAFRTMGKVQKGRVNETTLVIILAGYSGR